MWLQLQIFITIRLFTYTLNPSQNYQVQRRGWSMVIRLPLDKNESSQYSDWKCFSTIAYTLSVLDIYYRCCCIMHKYVYNIMYICVCIVYALLLYEYIHIFLILYHLWFVSAIKTTRFVWHDPLLYSTLCAHLYTHTHTPLVNIYTHMHSTVLLGFILGMHTVHCTLDAISQFQSENNRALSKDDWLCVCTQGTQMLVAVVNIHLLK